MTDTVMVVGASGVLGAYVVRALALAGHDVRALDVRPPDGFQRQLLDSVGVTVARADITDEQFMSDLLIGDPPAAVVNLAVALPRSIDEDVLRALDINVRGAVALLHSSRRAGVPRSIVLSSKAVYGPVVGVHAHPTFTPLIEDHPARPESLYERMKHLVEGTVEHLRRDGYQGCAALRTATQWGPGKLVARHAKTVHSWLLEAGLRGERIEIARGADQATDLISYPELARAVVACLDAPVLRHAIYNVGSGNVHTLRDFAEQVRRHNPGLDAHLGGGLDPEGDGRQHYCLLDITRARTDWSWDGPPPLWAQVDECVQLLRSAGTRHG